MKYNLYKPAGGRGAGEAPLIFGVLTNIVHIFNDSIMKRRFRSRGRGKKLPYYLVQRGGIRL